MSAPDGFLRRWSQRKRAAQAQESPAETDLPAPIGAESAANTEMPETAGEAQNEALAARDPAPDFDLSSLPAIETLDAASDAHAFMQPGVPLALRNAALQRLWREDPAIRDFIGPVEMGWNFNDPNGVAGFGPLDANIDLGAMLRGIVGAPPEPAEAQKDEASPQDSREREVEPDAAIAPQAARPASLTHGPGALRPLVQEPDASSRVAEPAPSPPLALGPAKRHGGALPFGATKTPAEPSQSHELPSAADLTP